MGGRLHCHFAIACLLSVLLAGCAQSPPAPAAQGLYVSPPPLRVSEDEYAWAMVPTMKAGKYYFGRGYNALEQYSEGKTSSREAALRLKQASDEFTEIGTKLDRIRPPANYTRFHESYTAAIDNYAWGFESMTRCVREPETPCAPASKRIEVGNRAMDRAEDYLLAAMNQTIWDRYM